MLIISPEILEDGTLNNMDFQQGYTDNLLLIPGPLDPDNSSASLEQWTWDQNLKKAHIPLTKCFALSDFGWGNAFTQRCQVPRPGGSAVYMIKWGQRVDAGRRCKRRPGMSRQLAP